MRNKKIQILLVFVLAIGLFGLLFYWRYGEKKQMESLNGLQETYKEYDKKIREIRNDMENKKAEVNDIEKPANVILTFSEEDQELMDRIVPALEGRGIQATLVLKNTAEHHQETVTYLGQQGWDFAFGGEIGEEKDAYIEMLKSRTNESPENKYIDDESKRMLEENVMANLSAMEKKVLSLYLKGKKYTEIAIIVEKDEKSIDNALQRIKKKISKIVAERQ